MYDSAVAFVDIFCFDCRPPAGDGSDGSATEYDTFARVLGPTQQFDHLNVGGLANTKITCRRMCLPQIRAPQPKQYCQCCHRQLRRFFVCDNCGKRCCVQDCLAVHAHGNYCVDCAPPPPLQSELVAEEIGSYYATLAKPEETSIAGGGNVHLESEQITGDGEGSAAADDNNTDSGDYVMLKTDESEQDRVPKAGHAASQ